MKTKITAILFALFPFISDAQFQITGDTAHGAHLYGEITGLVTVPAFSTVQVRIEGAFNFDPGFLWPDTGIYQSFSNSSAQDTVVSFTDTIHFNTWGQYYLRMHGVMGTTIINSPGHLIPVSDWGWISNLYSWSATTTSATAVFQLMTRYSDCNLWCYWALDMINPPIDSLFQFAPGAAGQSFVQFVKNNASPGTNYYVWACVQPGGWCGSRELITTPPDLTSIGEELIWSAHSQCEISIYSTLGQLLFTAITGPDGKVSSGLPTGIYFYRVDKKYCGKVLIKN